MFQMLSLLEHMYTDLGLVREYNINPITLKRWLVSTDTCTTHVSIGLLSFIDYAAAPIGWGHNEWSAVVCVVLYVTYTTPKSRTVVTVVM